MLGNSMSTNQLQYVDLIINYVRNKIAGGGGEGLYGYPCLNHIIQLCPGYWVELLSKINEEVDDLNQHQKSTQKRWLVRFFSKQIMEMYWAQILAEY